VVVCGDGREGLASWWWCDGSEASRVVCENEKKKKRVNVDGLIEKTPERKERTREQHLHEPNHCFFRFPLFSQISTL
jgi:hypothetical protein